MSKYIARQQIKDVDGSTVGYEIVYYGENQAFSSETAVTNEFAAADTIYNVLMQNTSKTLKGALHFMTFTPTLLMRKTPYLFPKEELVIQIDDSVIIHPLSMHFVQKYASEGYRIAVNEFQFAPRYLDLLNSIDYLKINAKSTGGASMGTLVEAGKSMGKKCIVTGLDSEELYQKAVQAGADFFEGKYVSQHMVLKAHNSAYLQGNFFRLMVAVTEEEPDVDEIEKMIAADASLTYGLLKVANSVYYALRKPATTIHQAIVTMGMGQLKQWIYLLSASNGDNQLEEGSEEFLKTSFMRANFCSELVNCAKGVDIPKAEAYLMGMFSTLNYLIDAPMEDILAEVPVSDQVREALLHKTGPCGQLYELVLSYEAADWEKISQLAEQLKIPNHLLTSLYFVCMENTNMLWQQLTSPSIYQTAKDGAQGEDAETSQAGQPEPAK